MECQNRLGISAFTGFAAWRKRREIKGTWGHVQCTWEVSERGEELD